MKICPQCNAHYEDSMFFCLEDGTPLRSTDNSVQSNPATFENTLILPTNEKTLPIIPETQTEQKSIETKSWQPETAQQQKSPNTETNENVVLASYAESNNSSGKFVLIGALFGGITLLGIAFGGWWFLQNRSDEIAVANNNKQLQNSNSNSSLGLSNSNISNVFGETNPNNSNVNTGINTNSSANNNLNRSTPKPSPSVTKDKDETPTPTPTATPQTTSTPIPKTPTSTPTPAPTRETPKIVSGGVLNGKAVNLIKPPYPPAARAVRASGAVSVQVLIDEEGNVVRAAAVSGHPMLRAAAEQAARSSKFSPTMLGGQAVKVTGVIVYNFSAQ